MSRDFGALLAVLITKFLDYFLFQFFWNRWVNHKVYINKIGVGVGGGVSEEFKILQHKSAQTHEVKSL